MAPLPCWVRLRRSPQGRFSLRVSWRASLAVGVAVGTAAAMVVLPVLAPVSFITTFGDTVLLLGVSFALAPWLPSYAAQKVYGATRKSLTKAGLAISYVGAAAVLIGNAKELWTNTGMGWAVTADLLIVVALALIFCVAFRAEAVRKVLNRLGW